MNTFAERLCYRFFKSLFGLGLRVYYKEITVDGLDNVPIEYPIITVSNHPTGLMDALLAGYHIERQIKFTAAGSLFKDKLQAAFMASVGTIPVYRRKDSMDEIDKNVESFEHCFRELEAGAAIGFYPEGTSHPEPWVYPIKTGTARVALQAEDRNNFKLNLKLVPIGINSPNPGTFRGEVFVNIGNPISLETYRDIFRKDPVASVEKLSDEIERRIQSCTLHIRDGLLLNLVENLNTIGYDAVDLNNQGIDGKAAKFYHITKALENRFDQNGEKDRETLGEFVEKSSQLRTLMRELLIAKFPSKGVATFIQTISLLLISILGLPFVLPSVIVNVFPFVFAKYSGKKLAGKDTTLIPAARLMIGTVVFILYYTSLFFVLGNFISLINAAAVMLFFLIGGYITLWYWEAIRAFISCLMNLYLWLTDREAIKDLIRKREKIHYELNQLLDPRQNFSS